LQQQAKGEPMKKVFICLVFCFWSLALVNSAFSKQSSDSVRTIRLGTFSRAIDYSPYYVAKSKKWWEDIAKKYGATVEYTEFQSLPSINEALASGRIDAVFEAEAPAIIGKAAGIDLKIVAPGVDLTQQILVQKDSSIRKISDLKGKKIAVLAGTSAHYGVHHLLEQNGLSPKDVEILDITPPDAKAAFEAKQVDAWGVWPPFPEQELVAGKGRVLSDGKYFIQSIMVMRGEFINEHPALAKDLVHVLRRAQNWIVANKPQAEFIVAKELNLPLVVVQLAYPKHNFHPKFGPAEIKDLQEKSDFLYQNKFVKNHVDVTKGFIDVQ